MSGPRRQKAAVVQAGAANEADVTSFSLFDREEEVLRRSAEMLQQLEAVAGGVNQLASAYRQGYREQQRLVRLSDRMQGDLQRAKARLAEQARDLQALNETLAAEVQHRTRLEAELRLLLETDALTGARTRRRFFELAEAEVPRCKRHALPVSVMLLDLDRFKQLNDQFGHDVGDRALHGFAQACLALLPAGSIFGRLGGEEFGLLLPEMPLEGAQELALRLCAATACLPLVDHAGRPVPLSVSIGLAGMGAAETLSGAMRRADMSLYDAKRHGRGRVVVAGD